jgi:hypothetical protein
MELASASAIFSLFGIGSIVGGFPAQVEKKDIPLGTGVLATIYFLMGSISGYLLVQARDAFGWGLGSIAIYGVPYLIAAAIMIGLMLSGRPVTQRGGQ